MIYFSNPFSIEWVSPQADPAFLVGALKDLKRWWTWGKAALASYRNNYHATFGRTWNPGIVFFFFIAVCCSEISILVLGSDLYKYECGALQAGIEFTSGNLLSYVRFVDSRESNIYFFFTVIFYFYFTNLTDVYSSSSGGVLL
jgi:hypothetical protein